MAALRIRRALAALLLLVASATIARAAEYDVPTPDWDVLQSGQCAAAIAGAEERYDLPRGLLLAIAKVESGRPVATMSDIRPWPWTINADGTGYFFESRAAAVAWAQLGLQRGVRFMDVGCMQVDWQLHPGAFRSLDEAFDPRANADYAARFLRKLHDEAGGNWFIAVGLYHSHTPDLAADYRARVAAVGSGIITGHGGPEPLYRRAMRQGTLRLAMAGGHVLLIHIGRQPALHRTRRSACEIAALLRPLLAAPPRAGACPHG